MFRFGKILYSAALVLSVPSLAHADVHLPAVLADHMVVQRSVPVHIWGTAAAGEPVSVTFRQETRRAVADDLGRWSVYLSPGQAGGPFEVAVKGANAITLHDVLVGEVWVASGQSNMEWPLSRAANAQTEIEKAKLPRVRLFRVKNRSSEYPLDDVAAEPWTECSPETVRDFSAIAYFFGRDLHERLGVPVGLIESAWGGTPADAWTSLGAIASDAALMPVFAEWARMMDAQSATLLRRKAQLEAWQQASERANAEGKPAPGRPWAPNEDQSWRPAALYNAMIAPLTRFPIRGAIWYQGESNASRERAPVYGRLFQTMIHDWRRAWGIGDFPFLFVQLANYKADQWWPVVREAQRETLQLANTGMAVTIDIGDPSDIHPKNKQDVGSRLARWARVLAYGEQVESSGPLFRMAAPDGSAMRVWFDHAAGLNTRGGAPASFEIAGTDRKFVRADARVDGETVVVSAASVPSPVYVRYGWSDVPDCNLFNGAGLPASPFRSAE
jgi:sialate O-acetylesterase